MLPEEFRSPERLRSIPSPPRQFDQVADPHPRATYRRTNPRVASRMPTNHTRRFRTRNSICLSFAQFGSLSLPMLQIYNEAGGRLKMHNYHAVMATPSFVANRGTSTRPRNHRICALFGTIALESYCSGGCSGDEAARRAPQLGRQLPLIVIPPTD
jgi:hypothetical protein